MIRVEDLEHWMEAAWHPYSAQTAKGERLSLEVSGLGALRVTIGGRPLYQGVDAAKAARAFNDYVAAHCLQRLGEFDA